MRLGRFRFSLSFALVFVAGALLLAAAAAYLTDNVTFNAEPADKGDGVPHRVQAPVDIQAINVDPAHPSASDEGAGTVAEPVRTIGEALARADARNRNGVATDILIAPGTYREALELPDREGTTDAAIHLKGTSAEQVVVSGSDVWQDWTEESGIYRHDWPYRWGLARFPPRWEDSFAAEQLRANPVIRRREMIFVDGRPLTQVVSMQEVRQLKGSFFVSESEGTVYMHPSDGVLVPQATVEVAVRPHLFAATNRQNVSLEGLTFQHASSPLEARAVSFFESSGIEVVDSRFLWNSWLGLGFVRSSDVVVKRSVANHNGVGGMGALQVDGILFENTETSHNNWRGVRGAEDTQPGRVIDENFVDWATGQKFFRLRDATFRHHRSIGNMTGGLWFDFDNSDVTLENLVIAGNRTHGIFIEASQGPFRLRDSRICDNESGLLITNSQDGDISGNVIAGNLLAQLFIGGRDTRLVNDSRTGERMSLRSEQWKIADNIVAGGTDQFWMATSLPSAPWSRFVESLESDRNRWLHSGGDRLFRISDGRVVNLAEWRSHSGQDEASTSSPAPWDCAILNS